MIPKPTNRSHSFSFWGKLRCAVRSRNKIPHQSLTYVSMRMRGSEKEKTISRSQCPQLLRVGRRDCFLMLGFSLCVEGSFGKAPAHIPKRRELRVIYAFFGDAQLCQPIQLAPVDSWLTAAA
jgi:hypothetical protein